MAYLNGTSAKDVIEEKSGIGVGKHVNIIDQVFKLSLKMPLIMNNEV